MKDMDVPHQFQEAWWEEIYLFELFFDVALFHQTIPSTRHFVFQYRVIKNDPAYFRIYILLKREKEDTFCFAESFLPRLVDMKC